METVLKGFAEHSSARLPMVREHGVLRGMTVSRAEASALGSCEVRIVLAILLHGATDLNQPSRLID